MKASLSKSTATVTLSSSNIHTKKRRLFPTVIPFLCWKLMCKMDSPATTLRRTVKAIKVQGISELVACFQTCLRSLTSLGVAVSEMKQQQVAVCAYRSLIRNDGHWWWHSSWCPILRMACHNALYTISNGENCFQQWRNVR